MPTHDEDSRFWGDFHKLSAARQAMFRVAVAKLVDDLIVGRFRKGLRVKRVQGNPGVWEMTWADNGRATFEYGRAKLPGDPHVIWRRVGSHDNLDIP